MPMRLIRYFGEVPAALRGGVIALGNFDGLHLGHQAVIGEAVRLARAKGVAAAVMTFEPHPRLFFQPEQEPFRLSPFRIKARLIEAMGIDYLYVQAFDREFSQRTADNFIDEILVGGLGVSHVVVGFDYVFGRGRAGNVALLQAKAAAGGFGVTAVDEMKAATGPRYSSSNIRDFLKAGRCGEAAALLGRYWEIEGRVEHGDQRGRFMGFPTANLPHRDYLHPRRGVYAVRAGIDRGAETIWHNAIANFGYRPTFNKKDLLLEVHIFDFNEDLYQKHLRVALVDYLRPEMKFAGLEAIKAQIAQDCVQARGLLAGHGFVTAKAPYVGFPAGPP
ncbi:MAG: bifunctional riboflavin kinase/FAD synthetase [Rhodospirillaceae bacterium]|nr:bifunctional riboflavin kinase/FAD synthetase [Rhodospirillaceae bacterium]